MFYSQVQGLHDIMFKKWSDRFYYLVNIPIGTVKKTF